MLSIQCKQFNELSLNELYQLLKLRAEVFIVEQNCIYQDIDNKDSTAYHVLVTKKNCSKIIAYARILIEQEPQLVRFGRVLCEQTSRGSGTGKELIKSVLAYIKKHHPNVAIHISAQTYLREFYQGFGFIAQGAPYNEEGIPHILMTHEGP